MKTLSSLIVLLITFWFSMTAQQTTFKNEFLKKWSNIINYTIEVAEKMPMDKYSFRPNTEIRTFGEQIEHLAMAMTYHSKSAIDVEHSKFKGDTNSKEEVLDYLKSQFNAVKIALKNTDESKFEESVSFWAGRMTRRKILNLTNDHITHHRAQAILYLRLNKIKAPDYIAW
ncbi:DinB family protein [Aquimarina sp. AD10]|uniref:DinB family protein n=1 Tax=Aquimarina sp. AD10 TaxID=1714849 RepID=UPI000E516278|nr:DinB family protein [Aquimarina sp. AD10]AXT59227.1 DinB family protein [Aquimarina sp. AD10]RKM92717.1 DinB family protein [Aquimarina sp. AD10]